MQVAPDIALSQLMVVQEERDIVAHNLANANTAGFRQHLLPHSEFKGNQGGNNFSYVQALLMVRSRQAGALKQTNDPYHVYLKGEGYFAVQAPQGVRYTRAGAFTLDNQSQLVTPQGYPVLDEGLGPIIVPEGDLHIQIASDGTISNKEGIIARLGFFTFENPHLIRDEEDTLVATEQAPIAAVKASVLQYAYEGSNVNTVLETTRLIALMTAYQQTERLLEEQNKLTSKTTEGLGRSIQV